MGIFADIVGWAGMVMIVGAYYFVSNKKLDPVGKMYQWLNLIGSAGVGVNVVAKQAWPSLALQIVWGLVAIGALIKTTKRK